MPNLEDFEGTWTLARRIEDLALDRIGTLTGQARFSRTETGLTYEETGQLTLPGSPPLSAARRYLWSERDGEIIMHFADGRPFHTFRPGQQDTAHHQCPPDTYDVQYDFKDWPVWTAIWQVEGPRKAYRLTSHYTRAPSFGL